MTWLTRTEKYFSLEWRKKSHIIFFGVFAALVFIGANAVRHAAFGGGPVDLENSYKGPEPLTSTASTTSPPKQRERLPGSFWYAFNTTEVLEESFREGDSASPYWWLSSGGELLLGEGIGRTLQGAAYTDSRWRREYAADNPLDSGNGFYPQNLFRLVSRSTWQDADQRVRFRIDRVNMTDTPNRGEWSGIFLMSRYQNPDTLYYGGIRMEGMVVIKKKYKGTYHTLGQKRLFSGPPYHRDLNPTIIPDGWMGLRTVTRTTESGTVMVELFVDRANTGVWERLLVVHDTNAGGAPAITQAGRVGIRTDYMDASFDDYAINELRL